MGHALRPRLKSLEPLMGVALSTSPLGPLSSGLRPPPPPLALFPRPWLPPRPQALSWRVPPLRPLPRITRQRPPHNAFICNECPDPLSFHCQHKSLPGGNGPPEGLEFPT